MLALRLPMNQAAANISRGWHPSRFPGIVPRLLASPGGNAILAPVTGIDCLTVVQAPGAGRGREPTERAAGIVPVSSLNY